MKLQKLPSGNFRAVVAAGYDENGKRIYKSFTAPEEWQVLKMVEDFKRTREESTDKNVTVRKAMEFYIESRANVLEQTTIRNYRQLSSNCFRCIADTKLSALKAMDIQRAINIESAKVSPKYIKNAYGFLKSVLKMYEVDINLNNIKLPKLVRTAKDLPSFETVFSIVKGTESELPVLLAAWLSLRIGEVIGLQFQDVDKENRKIHIRRTIIMTDEGSKVRESCKTEKSTRTIQLPAYILELIQAIPHESETDFIIPKSRKAVYSKFKRLMKKHDIELTFHDLRHLNASVMLMLGIPDKYAMERGGWSTDNVLKSVYQQTFSSEREKVDNMIDDYFTGIVDGLNAANPPAV